MPYLIPNPLSKLKVGDKVRLIVHKNRERDVSIDRIVTVTMIDKYGNFSISRKRKDLKYNLFQFDGLPLNKTKGQVHPNGTIQ